MINPLISIIIPCYNTEKYLPQCLDSIVAQTYNNLEIICVIDGSPDNSLRICKQYAQNDSRIVIIEQSNQGLSGARNTGVAAAHGDYIMFVDSDDWIEHTTCEKAVDKINKDNYDLIVWSYIREFANTQKEKKILGECDLAFDSIGCKRLHRRIFGLTESELSDPENADSLVTAWGKLYRFELIKDIKFVDTKEIGTEDALFNCYALKNVKSAYYIADCLNHYRKDNNTSLTSTYKEKLFVQWQHLYDLMELCISDNDLGAEFEQALNNRISMSIIGLGLNELDNKVVFLKKIKNIKTIIASKKFRAAYKKFTLQYFPLHWKVFFLFAKMNFATGVFILLSVIKKLIGRG